MIKVVAGFFILMVMISAGTVYSLKETNESLEQRKEKLSSLILKDQAAIKVLRAEMAYLSRPERLARLSNRYLDLLPVRGEQMISSVAGVATRQQDGAEPRMLAGVTVDNFPMLLPQEKPALAKRIAHLKRNTEQENVYSATFSPEEESPEEEQVESFYTRIMTKIRSEE